MLWCHCKSSKTTLPCDVQLVAKSSPEGELSEVHVQELDLSTTSAVKTLLKNELIAAKFQEVV